MKALLVVLMLSFCSVGFSALSEPHPKAFIGKDTTYLMQTAGFPVQVMEFGKYTMWMYESKIGFIRFVAEDYIIVYYEILQQRDDGTAVVVDRYRK